MRSNFIALFYDKFLNKSFICYNELNFCNFRYNIRDFVKIISISLMMNYFLRRRRVHHFIFWQNYMMLQLVM